MASQSVLELAEHRQAVLNSFGDDDNEATDLANMERLYSVEAELVRAEYCTAESQKMGQRILLDNGESPRDWDNFKADLFMRIQEFV